MAKRSTDKEAEVERDFVKLYLLRHGRADWPEWSKSDDERPLTAKGKKEMAEVAKLLSRLEINAVILTSPLPRAQETAEIAGKFLQIEVRVEPALLPGFDRAKLKKLLAEFSDESLMLVGHEPDFTRAIFEMTGGETKLAKGGVACIDLDPSTIKGELRWLVPPKFAKDR